MKMATRKRRPGRPVTGTDPVVTLRLPTALRQEVDRRARKANVNRSEMIRMVLEKAMRKSGQ
jgi:metal-responsive CopG/Arc/MetJ family transcriptional regulator